MNILPLFLFLFFVLEHRSSTDPKEKKQNTTKVIALQSRLTPLDCYLSSDKLCQLKVLLMDY